MADRNSNGLTEENLWYYFDALERDRMDVNGFDRKNMQVMALRSKLLRLPGEQFDAAIRTIERLVEHDEQTSTHPTAKMQESSRKAALNLFQQVSNTRTKNSSPKTPHVL